MLPHLLSWTETLPTWPHWRRRRTELLSLLGWATWVFTQGWPDRQHKVALTGQLVGETLSIWVLTSFVFLTSFRFMSSFAFLNFFVGLTSLDFELFWCLMLFVLFCCLTSLVLCTLSKKCVWLLTFFYRNFFVPFYFCFQVHSVFMFCVFMELFQILLWHHFRTLILIGRTPWGGVVLKLLQ